MSSCQHKRLPLILDDPPTDDWDGLIGSEESLHSLVLDSVEIPSTMLPVSTN